MAKPLRYPVYPATLPLAGEHELARIHRRGQTGVHGRSIWSERADDLVQRAGERDARIVGDRSLQVRARRGGYGDRQPTGRRLAVLAVVQGDVTRLVLELHRSGGPLPSAVHVVRYLDLPGGVVRGTPAHPLCLRRMQE